MSYRQFERRADPHARLIHLAYPSDPLNVTRCSTVTKDHRVVDARPGVQLAQLDDDVDLHWPICPTCRMIGRVR